MVEAHHKRPDAVAPARTTGRDPQSGHDYLLARFYINRLRRSGMTGDSG